MIEKICDDKPRPSAISHSHESSGLHSAVMWFEKNIFKKGGYIIIK